MYKGCCFLKFSRLRVSGSKLRVLGFRAHVIPCGARIFRDLTIATTFCSLGCGLAGVGLEGLIPWASGSGCKE